MLLDFPTIIADESVDGRIIHFLQTQDYTVISIAKLSPGLSDSAVIEVAINHMAFIITEDKDFGDELIFKAPHLKVPTLLLRLSGLTIQEKTIRLSNTLNEYRTELKQSFSVLTPHKLRVRKFI
jgi:predicted nuclease of predicted toxin-antitoxin system